MKAHLKLQAVDNSTSSNRHRSYVLVESKTGAIYAEVKYNNSFKAWSTIRNSDGQTTLFNSIGQVKCAVRHDLIN